ncbi:MAG: flagellar basal body-associated FliL family protein [Humidesulfovibrio sp.]|uniref:flagellar basal body-associated FliL family protein n=1 Tax=Humidesulfovibrio sp. TaxID=2910988 RepID=UPI0027338B86|nr:flagellar basal body-associated FliL family protein [Humidesulfovibrio sp.]MDP2848102.1 flagellar basal body-associated FliL family protein [Humidesulfovibrio sp.]
MAADPLDETAGSRAGGDSQNDIAIDTSETSRGTQKVELDLDDAPFLEEEEEVKPEPVKPSAPVSLEPAKEEKPPLEKKKLIIIGAATLVLIIVAALAVKFLFFKSKAAPEPAKTEQAAPAQENATVAEPEKPEIHFRMEPFWVEQKAGPEEVRFLIVRMQLGTKDPAVAKDFEMKLLPARNAIFYYLKNKDVHFLVDEQNTDKLKAELLLVINQYVADGKFDTLMFEEYVVK